MTGRHRFHLVLLGAVAAAVGVLRHRHGAATHRHAPGGILVGDAAAYDRLTGLLFGSFFERVAADVAATAREGARVLDVGCGPGRLALLLAHRHGIDVTGVDLDPAMVGRARANAEHAHDDGARRPTFLAGDVASLTLPDASFDIVVSTLSMHHWADPPAGLTEIGRVLRPDGRALVWDLRPGVAPLHRHVPDMVEHARSAGLAVVDVAPWRWPWRLALTQRIELVHADA